MKVISIKKFYLYYKSYTGIVINNNDYISFYKNGFFHRKNGPAFYDLERGIKEWYKHNLIHREDGPAAEYSNGHKVWWFKHKWYGEKDAFTIETWKEKVKELKHEERLEIFK